jgi:hypothetical protein
MVTVVSARPPRPSAAQRTVPLRITAAMAPPAAARANAEVLAALDSRRPAGIALDDRAHEPGVRQLFLLRPASLLAPFDDPDADDVVWPVGDIRELVVVPEGLFIRAEGRPTPPGVGVGPEWVALPLLVEWASALHGDDSLASIRARVSRLAQGAQAS